MNYKSEWVCETTKGLILRGAILRRIALRTLLLNKLLLLAVLVSCSEESSRAQPQPSTTSPRISANPIVGTAALGLVSNARVDAYLIATENQAQQHKECSTDSKNKIGSGTTDNNGYFNLTLNLDSGYVLFVLSGGSYTEEATNQQVYLTDNQKLYAVHHYHVGETKEQTDIVISPWSHLMAGMFCYMTGSSARSPANSPAISMINTSAFITNWLGFDPRYVNYKDPTDTKNNRADLTFDEGVKLGFLNSAISELTKEWSATDEVTTHATINSIYLAQLMYEDINNDGSLDGRGAKGPLHIVRKVSNIPLNAATYRLSIPQQMLNFFDSNENNQIKDNGRGILYLLADSINSNEHPQIFQQQKSPPLDMLAPQVEWVAPNTKRLTGVVNISLRVKDFSGIERVTFYATSLRTASQNREQAIDDIYTFTVDTRPDGSGDFNYRVTTIDILGNEQTINFPVTLINEPPIIEIIAPAINNSGNNATTIKSAYLLKARFSKIVSAQNIAGAACSLNDEQNFDAVINKEESIASCAVVLPHNGVHRIEMKLCDDNNLCNTRGHNILFDDEPPVITPINEQESYQRNVSISFFISDATSGVIQPVTWTAIGNGKTMSGVAQQLSAEGTYQVLFDAARFGNSPVRLTINSLDSLKNMAARSQTYQVFNQPPTLRLTSAPKFNQDIYNAIFEVEENSYTNIKIACRLTTSIRFQEGDYQTTQSNNQQSEQTLKPRGECNTVSQEIQDGNHTLEIRICGDYNLCITQPITITKDTAPPMVRASNLRDEYDGAGGQIILQITDELSMVTSATFSINDNEAQDIIKRASDWTFALPLNLNTGKHTLTIVAVDALGNANTIQHDFLTLREEPIISRASALYTDSNLYRLAAQLDPGSYQGAYQAHCILAEQSVVASISHNRINCLLDTQGLNDGEHLVEIIIETDYDKSYTREISFIKDTTAPQINILNLLATYTNPVPSTLQVNINDELSPTTQVTYRINEGADMQLVDTGARRIITLPINELPTRRHTLTIQATDSVGNSNTMTRNFIVEKDAPIVTQASAQATNQGIYNLVATLDKGSYQGDYSAECQLSNQVASAVINGNNLKCLLDISSSSDNNYDIRVTLTADYGKSYTREISFIKDTTAPQISILNLQDEYDGAGGQVILEITDELSMVTSAIFSIDDNEAQDITKRTSDWTFALPLNLNTGKHKLTIVAVDALGNTNTMHYDFLTLREEPIISRTSSLYTDSNLYRLAAQLNSGSYQGAYQAQCILAEQSVVASIASNRINCSLDTRGLNDGEYQVEIILATDYDKSYTREISFIKDTTAPQINILNLLAAYTNPVSSSLQVNINDELSPTVRTVYRINGGGDMQLADAGTRTEARRIITLPINELPTGRHALTIQATDSVGNSNTMTRNFIVEKDAPIVTQTSAQATNQGIYNLVATLDKGSYQGVYSAKCQLSNQVVSATISGNTLKCLLDISSSSDNNYDIRVMLTADYGKSYTQTLAVTKDTAPPQIVAIEHQQAYSATPFALRYQVSDLLSEIASVTYLYGDSTQGLSARPIGNNLWEVDINPNLLLSGEHNVRVIVSDTLSNSLQINSPILIIKHPPQVTLAHQNVSNKDTLDISGTIILTSPEASVVSITCSFLRNPTGAITEGINGEINGNNFVCRSLPIIGLNNELVEVEICDIFANCAIYPTFVTHDSSPPILSSVAMPNIVNVYSCGEKNRYDDIPPNCTITQSPAANIYSISEQAQDLQKTNPPLIVVQQEATLLNNESIVINDFTGSIPNNELIISEIKINRAELDRRGIIFAGINVRDNELSPSRYFTDPYDLNITYSYTQIDCPTDDTDNQNLVCSHNNKKVYFTKIPIPQAAININIESSDAEITIPFSDELLSSPNNPLWYSAAPRTIHRLDIFICDEAGNCVQYVTRFRVTVLAATPTVTFNINNNFRNDFRRNDNLRYLFSVIQRNVRTWRVSNPSPTDMWVRIEQSPADIQYLAEMWIMRKINKYSTHRHRQFARKSGKCGNWPYSRTQYSSVIEYTTHTADYYSSTPNPRGPRFAAPHSSSYRLSCGSTGPGINNVRYEQINGYPRQRLTRERSFDKRINFAITLNRHLVNLAKGTKTPALEYNNWMLLPAGNSLLLTTDEKMTNDPGYYQPIMVYGGWRNIDRYRSVTIPASIGLSYTRSQVESASPSLSSVRSRIYQIPQIIVNNQRSIHCARADNEPAC